MRLQNARVFFTGTGGTGKTSVVKALQRLYDPEDTGVIKFLGSVARQVQKDFGVTEADQLSMDEGQRRALQQAIFEAKWTQSLENPGPALSDRTSICMLAYALQRSWERMTIDDYKACLIACCEEAHDMDLLVYFPVGLFDPPDDGFRLQHQVSRYQHDLLIQGIMEEIRDYLPPVYVVSDGSPEDRAVEILNALSMEE